MYNIHSYFIIFLCIIFYMFLPTDGCASLIIDDFDYGEFQIISEWDAPLGPNSPLVTITETGLPTDSTLGGTRHTWTQKGADFDIASATLNNGSISFVLDNDECRGGLVYDSFGEINLEEEGYFAFDLLGMTFSQSGWINVNLTLSDTLENTVSVSDSWGNGSIVGFENYETYFDLRSNIWESLNLTMINKIEISISGGLDWFNPQIDKIYTTNTLVSASTAPIPEPATIFLFGTSLASLIGSRIKKKKK